MGSFQIESIRSQCGPGILAQLKTLTTKYPGIMAAQVCTVDGFEIVSVHRTEESRRRLAAMASSIHALGSALAREVEVGSYENLVLEGSGGKVLMMSVAASGGVLLLTAIASNEVLFGHFHYACKTCSEALGRCVVEQLS